jgi:hypothetical protein
MSQPTIVESRRRGTPAQCPACRIELSFDRPRSYDGQLQIRCVECKYVFGYIPQAAGAGAGEGTSAGSSSAGTSAQGTTSGSGRRGLGTDYDLLEINVLATQEEIKKGESLPAVLLGRFVDRSSVKRIVKWRSNYILTR